MLLLGAGGQVGRELARTLAVTHALVPATRSGTLPSGDACECIDLADVDGLASHLDRLAPRIIVNAAAYTAVDRAEDEIDLADTVNHHAVAAIAQWAAAHQAMLVHFSTDYVFDGASATPQDEDADAAPLSAYGRSKWAGEAAIRESGCAHRIIRTAWIHAAQGQNFVRSILRAARAGRPLRVVADQLGSPTSARFVAEATAQMIRQFGYQPEPLQHDTVHVVCAGSVSWHGFAVYLLERAAALGLIDAVPPVEGITTAQWPTRARRPAHSVLDCTRLESRYGIRRPTWQTEADAVLLELAAGHSLARE